MSIEAMKLALEALRKAHPISNSDKDLYKHSEALTALRQALAEQPAQQRHISYVCPQCHWSLDKQQAQQQWVGLTDEERAVIVEANTTDDHGYDIWCDGDGVARVVEAKLKEKNT